MTAGTSTTQTYSVLYSYPTTDRHYRGQRGVRVQASSQADALAQIRAGVGGYDRCPDAQIVRCQLSTRQAV